MLGILNWNHVPNMLQVQTVKQNSYFFHQWLWILDDSWISNCFRCGYAYLFCCCSVILLLPPSRSIQVLKLTYQQRAWYLKLLLRCFIWNVIYFVFWTVLLSFQKELQVGTTCSMKMANDIFQMGRWPGDLFLETQNEIPLKYCWMLSLLSNDVLFFFFLIWTRWLIWSSKSKAEKFLHCCLFLKSMECSSHLAPSN